MKTNHYLLFYALIALLFGCGDNPDEPEKEIEIDPETAIIGKWQLVEESYDDEYYSQVTNGRTKEYYSDGTLNVYFPDTDTYKEYTYCIRRNVLYHYPTNPDAASWNYWIYYNEFYDDKVKEICVYGLLTGMDTEYRIYQRIN